MKNKILILILFVTVFTLPLKPALADFNSSTNPASTGVPVKSMVELGSVYSNIYDITITVLETIRGKEAMNRLKKSGSKNKMPPNGKEYLLVRIRFEIQGRVVSDTLSFNVGDNPLQWVALTSDLMEYPQVSVTVPKPALAKRVKSGESLEGWLAFAVDCKDKEPVMVFDPDSGGATGRGRTLFFKLY